MELGDGVPVVTDLRSERLPSELGTATPPALGGLEAPPQSRSWQTGNARRQRVTPKPFPIASSVAFYLGLNTRLHFLQSCVESLPETAACPSVRILDYSSRDPIEVRNAGVVNTEADKNVQCR